MILDWNKKLLMTLVTTGTTAAAPWWTGVPTRLIAKTTLVSATENRLPVHTLSFAMPKIDNFIGKAKAHSKIQADLGDVVKMVIPGYKPKSYSVSELRKHEFDVTFKVYPNGRASGYLDQLQVGDSIHTFGMSAGRVRNPGSYIGIVAYGVGITEGLPVAQAELNKGDAQQVTLLWASRTLGDMFWQDRIELLRKKYPNRFRVVQILSREEQNGFLHGRIDAQVLQKVFQPKNRDGARFLSVGTKEMMRLTDDMFASIDFPMPKHALLPKKENTK